MKLTNEEKFALEKMFGSESEFDRQVRAGIFAAEVVERKNTKVGFFSTVKFLQRLPDSKGQLQWDWNFQHEKLAHGGSFMAYLEPPDVIEIEAVVHDGVWPVEFEAGLFREEPV